MRLSKFYYVLDYIAFLEKFMALGYVRKFLPGDKDYEGIECDRASRVCAVRVQATVGRINEIAMREFAVKLFVVALSSATAAAQDIGCFVDGVCGSGTIVGGNDRLPDEQGSSPSNRTLYALPRDNPINAQANSYSII